MAEQINFAGDVLSVTVNVIDETGAHVAQSGDFVGSTAFLAGVDQSLSSPTVATIGTGVYRLSWSGVSAWLLEGADVLVMVHGGTASGAWTPYGVQVLIRAAERGTDGVDTTGLSTFDHTSDEVITDTASRDASKADVSGLATQTELDKVPKKDIGYVHTNQAGDNHTVTITDV